MVFYGGFNPHIKKLTDEVPPVTQGDREGDFEVKRGRGNFAEKCHFCFGKVPFPRNSYETENPLSVTAFEKRQVHVASKK